MSDGDETLNCATIATVLLCSSLPLILVEGLDLDINHRGDQGDRYGDRGWPNFIKADKAAIERMRNNYSGAVSMLDNMILQYGSNPYIPYLMKLRCYFDAEGKVKSGEIVKEDAAEYIRGCYPIEQASMLDGKKLATGLDNAGEDVSNDIRVFPNPAKDKLTISYPANVFENASFELYTIQGKLVLSSLVDSRKSQLDLSNLSFQEGVYLYVIKDNNQSQARGKVVIVKN